MITGSKRRRADEPGENAKRAGFVALIIALAAGAAVSLALMAQQPASTANFGMGDAEPHIDADEEHER
jgi:hypothetical protein